MLAHPVELTVELHGHPWLQGVVDGAQHIDGVVGQRSDGAAGLAQGVLEDVDESLGHSLGSAEPRLQLRPEAGHPLGTGTGLGGPHVLRVVRGRQVEFREVGRLHTDVEGLEEVVHPGRGLHAQRQRQPLGLRGRVPAVHARRRGDLLLHLEVSQEEGVQRRGQAVPHLRVDAVPGELDEADLAGGGVHRSGDLGLLGVGAAGGVGGDVDDGDVEVSHVRSFQDR